MKKMFFLGAVAMAVASVLSSCSESENPTYDNVTPPTVKVAPSTVTAVISSKSGAPVSGATVQVGPYSATTGADGIVVFTDVAAGIYQVKVTAPGMFDYEGTVTVENSQVTQYATIGVVLSSEEAVVSKDIVAAVGGGLFTATEAITGNEKAIVPIAVDVPANALSADSKITITPFYNESEVLHAPAATRTIDDKEVGNVLMGFTISCSNPLASLVSSVPVSLTVDVSLAGQVVVKKLVNGTWVDITSTVDADKIKFVADAFTSYGIFLPSVDISISRVQTSPIEFEQKVWDNLYGAESIYVSEAKFQYNVGASITTKGATALEAFLIEKIAADYGAVVKKVDGVYPIDVTLPIGTRLSMEGNQEYATITCSAGAISVTAVGYGDVSLKVLTYNRQHTGGSN